MTGPERRRVRYESVGHLLLRSPPPGDEPAPLLLAVHGYRQPPAEMLEYAVSVAPAEAVVLVPVGPSAFYLEPELDPAERGVGHGWSADPDREASDARNDALLQACIDSVASDRPTDPARTALLGYSQGVGVAAHWWASRPHLAAGLVALAGGVREADRPRLEALRARRILQVSGVRDAFYPPAYEAALAERLRGMGIEVATLVLPTGHGVLAAARDPVRAWLASFLG